MSYLYALKDHGEVKGAFPIDESDALMFNKKGFGIFFSVNSFHTTERRENNLSKLNYWFVDMDEGTKTDQWKKIAMFMTPSSVVETKKGFHVYWKCEEVDITEEVVVRYKNILERLVMFFKSDPNAKGVTRILRAPGYYHQKDPANPYMIEQRFESEKVYSFKQMELALPEKEKKASKKSSTDYGLEGDFWNRVFEYDCMSGLEQLSGAKELNGDEFEFEQVGEKHKIIVNGEVVKSCWIDPDGFIGSNSDGGPNIGKWVKWYDYEWDEVARILKKYIPDLNEDLDQVKKFLSN